MRARPRSFAPWSAELIGRRWTDTDDGDSSDSARAVVIDPPGGPSSAASRTSTASTCRGLPSPPTAPSGSTTRLSVAVDAENLDDLDHARTVVSAAIDDPAGT
ncbi:hypothetical protein OV203_33895 [Nannocystis sp. ILAH1]|uniref:hypothetical protein n=1 Tax=unclassified Nannocystis TaxID=2627009 RepID=UPI002270EE82|nr:MULTISPECIES: hypothetical protein [unclassified Nannocystis]MCY0992180.1 hypothetical protein [Nannocystis sp. ILAH1]MCY1064400.1 hypothetical protein [Nannocystis sp. RBIL2]